MPRPRSDISERIQRAAREQFLAQGVDGASLRAIAAEAGTNIGMVYYYFPTKDDLFLSVVQAIYSRLVASAEVQAASLPFAEKVRRIYARIWRMSEDEYATVRLIMREAMVSADRVRRLRPLFAAGHLPLLFGMLNAGVNEGALRGDVPPLALLSCLLAVGMMPMLAWRVAGQRVMPDLPLPGPDELAGIFSTILLDGVGKRSGASAAPKSSRALDATGLRKVLRTEPQQPARRGSTKASTVSAASKPPAHLKRAKKIGMHTSSAATPKKAVARRRAAKP